jgi:hypothetical protein
MRRAFQLSQFLNSKSVPARHIAGGREYARRVDDQASRLATRVLQHRLTRAAHALKTAYRRAEAYQRDRVATIDTRLYLRSHTYTSSQKKTQRIIVSASVGCEQCSACSVASWALY